MYELHRNTQCDQKVVFDKGNCLLEHLQIHFTIMVSNEFICTWSNATIEENILMTDIKSFHLNHEWMETGIGNYVFNATNFAE